MTLHERVHAVPDDALGNTSYVLDVGDGAAVVVDPRRDVEEYLAVAQQTGLRIVATVETHLHADFVGGALELADVTGAAIYGAADARIGFDHVAVSAGTRMEVGSSSIEVLATPGHTPEHVSFLLRSHDGQALFSGGSLIVGGAARTDLNGQERTDELSRAQFTSLRRLAALPGDTLLYPTHGAGSFCSTGASTPGSSTIEAERRQNPLLSVEDEDEFVTRLVSGLGSYPRYFAHLRDLNRAGSPLLRALPEADEIAPETARDAMQHGAYLIDGRDWTTWALAHPQGAISIEVRPAFASWLGWVVPFGAPFVLVLEPANATEAIRLARRIGYDRIEGWTTFDAWSAAGMPEASLDTVDPEQAADRVSRGALLLDVRQKTEYASQRIPGAAHLELGDIIAGKSPEASDVITYCGHGERSATAASLLARRGLRVANLRGGTTAWRRAGFAFDR